MSSCQRGRRSRSNLASEQNYSPREQTPFGKRMGANFFPDEESNSVAVKTRSSKTNCKSACHRGTNDTPIFKSEVLEETEDSDGNETNYRKKGMNQNSGNNPEPILGSMPSLVGKKFNCVEGEIENVADTLRCIQETQDEILDSLRHDVEIIQTENAILRQNNNRLQKQVSQMNQLVADLSFDLRQMRDLISSKQQLGVSIPLADIYSPQSLDEGVNCRRKIKSPLEGSTESSPGVLTPPDETTGMRTGKHRKIRPTNPPPPDSIRKHQHLPKTANDYERGLRREKTQKRSSSHNQRAPVSAPPPQEFQPKKSSCFSGFFGRRKTAVPNY